jgi:hypothetical protein
MDESFSANFAEPALLQGRAAGVGQPFTERPEDRGQRLETSGKRPKSSFYTLAFGLMRSDVRREISGKLFQPLTSNL